MDATAAIAWLLAVLTVLAAPAVAVPQDDVAFTSRVLPSPLATSNGAVIEVVDLDGDGWHDLLVSSLVSAWRNVGRGRLVPLPAPGAGPLVADLDGDGLLTLFGCSNAGVRGREFGAPFVLGPLETITPSGFSSVKGQVTADVDGDGAPDLVVSASNALHTYLNDGSGGLQAPFVAATPANAQLFEVGDLDGDGDLDLLTTLATPFLGTGDGHFVKQPPLMLFGVPSRVRLGHVDGDGILDLAATSSQITEVLRGHGDATFSHIAYGETFLTWATVCDLGDADGDGDVEVLALAAGSKHVAVHEIVDGTLVARPGFAGFENSVEAVFADFEEDGAAGVVLCGSIGGPQGATLYVPGDGTGDLALRQTLLAGTPLGKPLVADVDGDGRPNLVVRRTDTSELLVHAVPGDGTLGPAGPPTPVPAGADPAVAVRLDADGRQDVLLATKSAVTPLLSLGDGTFSTGEPVPLPGERRFAAGDLDLDGDDDLVVLTQDPVWHRCLGDGSFGPAEPLAGAGPYQSKNTAGALGDADGDGVLDLFIGRALSSPASLQWHRGLGSGSFAAPVDLGSADGSCQTVVRLADLEGDGDLDAVAYGSNSTSHVTVVRGDGAGGFAPASKLGVLFLPREMVLAELNGDGLLDIVASEDYGGHDVRWYLLQTADLGFTEVRKALLGRVPLDLDHDGRDELLVDDEWTTDPGLHLYPVLASQAFMDLGHASYGAAGRPLLAGAGPLLAGGLLRIDLLGAPGGAPVQFVLGSDGGLQPPSFTSAAPAPQLVVGGFSTSPAGALVLESRWPADVPAGFAVYVQAWVSDPGAAGGLAASNIVQLLTD